jgi:hypothetical protein
MVESAEEAMMAGSDRRGRFIWLGPLAGIAAAVLWTVGQSWPTALPGAPTGEAGTDYAAFYTNSKGAQVAAALVYLAGILCLVCFFVTLRRVLASVEGWPGVLTATAFGAGIVACALLLAGGVFPLAAVANSWRLDSVLAQVLWELGNEVGAWSAYPLVVLVGAVAAVAWRSRRLPRWYGWASAALAVLLLVPILAWLSLKLFLLWLLAVSISLLRHRELLTLGLDRTPAVGPVVERG